MDSDDDSIRNLQPRPSEPRLFPDQGGRDDIETHALISRLPGLHGKSEVFVFAANKTGGTADSNPDNTFIAQGRAAHRYTEADVERLVDETRAELRADVANSGDRRLR